MELLTKPLFESPPSHHTDPLKATPLMPHPPKKMEGKGKGKKEK